MGAAASVVAILALLFTVGSFWWIHARTGSIETTTPRAYAYGQGANGFRLRFPFAFFNSGARALIVADLRLVVEQHSDQPTLRWVTTRDRLRPEPDDGFLYATPFAVLGRSTREVVVEFEPSVDCGYWLPSLEAVELRLSGGRPSEPRLDRCHVVGVVDAARGQSKPVHRPPERAPTGRSTVEAQRDHRGAACLDSPPVDEGAALDQVAVEVRTARHERLDVVDLDRQHVAFLNCNVCAHHPGICVVRVGEAVDPRVHVAPVVVREPQDPRKDVVERVWVGDLCCVNADDGHDRIIGSPSQPSARGSLDRLPERDALSTLAAVSYDLAFWNQPPGFNGSPQATYEALLDDRPVDGLTEIAVEAFVQDILGAFPAATREPNGDTEWVTWIAPDEKSSFEVYWSRQHVLAMLRPLNPDIANAMIDIAFAHDCRLYDPQTGERFDTS